MACATTTYFVILKWKGPTFGESGSWVEGVPSDIGVASSKWFPNKKGYWHEVSSCQYDTYKNFARFYQIKVGGSLFGVFEEVPRPSWAGGSGDNGCANAYEGFFVETGADDAYSTISYDTTPIMMNRYVKPDGPANFLTGLYSDKANCNYTPFAQPGIQVGPYKWQSTCHGQGTKRELTLLELIGNACTADPAQRDAFCNSITDRGDNKRIPVACGGTDANLYDYNPTEIALGEVEDDLGNIKTEADSIADSIIAEQRKKIFLFALLILIVLIILFLVF